MGESTEVKDYHIWESVWTGSPERMRMALALSPGWEEID
jgi:hypothetical protein